MLHPVTRSSICLCRIKDDCIRIPPSQNTFLVKMTTKLNYITLYYDISAEQEQKHTSYHWRWQTGEHSLPFQQYHCNGNPVPDTQISITEISNILKFKIQWCCKGRKLKIPSTKESVLYVSKQIKLNIVETLSWTYTACWIDPLKCYMQTIFYINKTFPGYSCFWYTR